MKRNAAGLKTRTIDLGRAVTMLDRLPASGRLFPNLSTNSAVVSTRYGQWCRQRQKREDREAAAAGRPPGALARYRLHDQRHAFHRVLDRRPDLHLPADGAPGPFQREDHGGLHPLPARGGGTAAQLPRSRTIRVLASGGRRRAPARRLKVLSARRP